jgi:hypothetical protein
MNFISSSEALSKKALKGMYSIKSYMLSLSELPVTVSTHLFDSLARSILAYNCEIGNMDTYKAYYNATMRATQLITLIFLINAFLTKFTTHFVNIF